MVENNEPGGKTSDPDSRSHLDQREQRAALRRRRAAPGHRRRRRGHLRARPAQLPEPRRHREHDGAARRRRGGHLRHQRRQRRHSDHDQAGQGRARRPSSSTPARRRPPRSPGCPRCSTRRSSARRWSSSRRPSVGQLQNENTDWFGAIDRTGFGQEHNLAVSGGGEAMDYRLSLQLPRPERHHRAQQHPARFGLGRRTTTSGSPTTGSPSASACGARAQDDKFTPARRALQRGAVRPDPADPRPHRRDRLLRLARIRPLPRPTTRSSILNLAEEKAETYRAVGNLQAEYRLPWVNGLRANAHPRLRRDRLASGGTSRPARCTGSWRPAEAASRPGTTRSR